MCFECFDLSSVENIGIKSICVAVFWALLSAVVSQELSWLYYDQFASITVLYLGAFTFIFFVVPVVIVLLKGVTLSQANGLERELGTSKQNRDIVLLASWLCLIFGMCLVLFSLFQQMGVEIVIAVLAVAWGTDTAAYVIGKSIGKRKIAPTISPNKTVAGTVGGYCVGVLVALLLGFLWLGQILGWGPIQTTLFALILPLTAIVGDLVESIYKRLVSAKESGNTLPGHGGLLDRLDSVVLSSGPLLWIALFQAGSST